MAKRPKIRLHTIALAAIVQEYESDLHVRGVSPNTIRTYLQSLGKLAVFLGDGAVLADLTPSQAKQFIRGLQEQGEIYQNHPNHAPRQAKLSKHTVHKHFRGLRSFGNWLNANGYDNPFSEMPKLKRPKRDVIDILTEDEIAKLHDLYGSHTAHGARWQALLTFFLGTGCRLSEVLTLTVDNLNMEKCRATVRGKGDKERIVVFGPLTHKALSRYLNLYRPESDAPYVFLGLDGKAMTESGIQNTIRNARKKSGIARLHTHLLRHTFATRFLLQGGSEFDLQMLLGHEDLSMTRAYVHLAKQLRGPGSMEEHRPDPLAGIQFGEPRTGRRARQIPATRAPAARQGRGQAQGAR